MKQFLLISETTSDSYNKYYSVVMFIYIYAEYKIYIIDIMVSFDSISNIETAVERKLINTHTWVTQYHSM